MTAPPLPAIPPAAPPPRLDPAFAADATVTVQQASVWFGQKVALTELSCSFGPGVTGLLGPNGAGKTTLMRALTGLLPLNEGRVEVLGGDPHRDREVQRAISLVPEDEAVPPALTARQLTNQVNRAIQCRKRAFRVDTPLEAMRGLAMKPKPSCGSPN